MHLCASVASCKHGREHKIQQELEGERRRTSVTCAKLLGTEWEVASGMGTGERTKRAGRNGFGNFGNHL